MVYMKYVEYWFFYHTLHYLENNLHIRCFGFEVICDIFAVFWNNAIILMTSSGNVRLFLASDAPSSTASLVNIRWDRGQTPVYFFLKKKKTFLPFFVGNREIIPIALQLVEGNGVLNRAPVLSVTPLNSRAMVSIRDNTRRYVRVHVFRLRLPSS